MKPKTNKIHLNISQPLQNFDESIFAFVNAPNNQIQASFRQKILMRGVVSAQMRKSKREKIELDSVISSAKTHTLFGRQSPMSSTLPAHAYFRSFSSLRTPNRQYLHRPSKYYSFSSLNLPNRQRTCPFASSNDRWTIFYFDLDRFHATTPIYLFYRCLAIRRPSISCEHTVWRLRKWISSSHCAKTK